MIKSLIKCRGQGHALFDKSGRVLDRPRSSKAGDVLGGRLEIQGADAVGTRLEQEGQLDDPGHAAGVALFARQPVDYDPAAQASGGPW